MSTDRQGPPAEATVAANGQARGIDSFSPDHARLTKAKDARSPRAALRQYVAERWQPTFAMRVVVGARLLLAGTAALMVTTLAFGAALPGVEYGVLVTLCLVQVATIAGIRKVTSPGAARALMLASSCVDSVLVASAAAIGGRTVTAVAFCTTFPMACAAVVPWRPGDQALLAVIELAATVANGCVVDGAVSLAGGEPAVMLIETLFLGASVVITYELERTRLAGGAEEMARHRSDQTLQELNVELERRVAERTYELEGRTRELERVVKELQSMSYTVSHDLRAPLRHINGFSTALREEYAEALGQRGCAYVDRMCAATQHMGSMIDSMLRLGRVTRADLARESVNLSAIVRSLSNDLQATAPDREVRWIIQDDVWASGDSGLLRVAIENLVDNALKFSRDRTPSYVEFGMDDGGGEAVYYVRDNGVGFDMRYYDKLFRLFTRLHGHEEFEGSGIGLATVQRAIERHGGRIWAHSAVAKGTTFFFTLGAAAS
ncbi:MAG: hypothetical protein HY899_06490 [Deltaproteobacteria bacterium]|nr:hypothetical protein [Deltaproteobacteria bacterium]